MKNNSSFQKKLKNMVLNKVVTLIGTGIILLVFGMAIAVGGTNYKNAKDNGKLYEEIFLSIYKDSSAFLRGENLQDLCKKIILYEEDASGLPFLVYELNASIPLSGKAVLSNKERNILYNDFSEQEWDFYRNSFNKAICGNAFNVPEHGIYTSVYYFDGNNSNYVLSKPIYQNKRTIGYINLYLDGGGWEKSLFDAEYEGVITDGKGRVIYSSRQSFIAGINKFNIKSRHSVVGINGRRYWFNKRFLEEANVIIYSLIYYPRNTALTLTALGAIIIIGGLWFKLTDSMTEEMALSNSAYIRQLVSEIKIISEDNPDYRINIVTKDEFSAVGIQINQMLDNIQDLNKKNTELLKLNNITEINHLTAQINPHFLYNTLEIIRNLLIFDNEKADELIIKLTQILRYSINNSKDYVFLEEDMSYIRDYLEIQKTRFEDSLDYMIDIEEDCYRCIVPKLIIQPLIENSIKHGFRKRLNIKIYIKGRIKNNILMLSVKDNGGGMREEEAKMLQENIYKANPESEHNGLHNIARRLFLLYGKESGLDIKSSEGESLEITIRIRRK